ncbi:MAG: rhodanese-like domain-containing protein [Cyanobacteria bacterium P01_D01_bin.44]
MTARPRKKQRIKPILLAPSEAKRELEKQLVIDVQNPKFATHMIPDAKRLNLDISIRDIPKDQPLLITCLNGQRSSKAAQHFINRGYLNICVLKGGLTAWQSASYTLWRTKSPT